MFVTVNKEKNTLVLGIDASDPVRAKHQGQVFITAMKAVLETVKACEGDGVSAKKAAFIEGLMLKWKMPHDVAVCVIEALVDMGALVEKDGVLVVVAGNGNLNASEPKVVGEICLN